MTSLREIANSVNGKEIESHETKLYKLFRNTVDSGILTKEANKEITVIKFCMIK